MTLNERLEAKRAEYAQVQERQQKLWVAYQAQEAILKRDYANPWGDAYSKSGALANEIKVLEAMVKEIAQ